MKLVLANNQSPKFVAFYKELQAQSPTPFDYSAYSDLLFIFDTDAEKPAMAINLATGKPLDAYDGIYVNNYINTYELAVTVAACADALGIAYVNREMSNAPAMSKLSTYAKLAAGGVRVPKTLAGTKRALLQAEKYMDQLHFPAILKRADADRGVDNYKVKDFAEIQKLLEPHEERSLWLLQDFIENNGFYLVSFYDGKPAFCIFRSLEARPDGNEQKAHMFKPIGGSNAQLVPLEEIHQTMLDTCQKAIDVSNRQIGSVDCIYDAASDKAYVLEVNYNPQLVTITTFKDIRIKAFLDNLKNIKNT